LVLSALNRIKSKHEEGGEYGGFGCQPIKVIGYSMGGVLARIALASAEDQGAFAHGSNLLLTVDSPHRGFVINENVQTDIKDIFGSITHHNPGVVNQVNSLLEPFDTLIDSPIARQLVRNNVTAISSPYPFFNGSDEYRDVFDFLNPCEAPNVPHINQDVDYYESGSYNEELDFKSGFPWKQNNIRKYAVAFGSAQPVGNIGDNGHFASLRAKGKILGFPISYTLNEIHSKWYDTCPASYFPTEFHYKQKMISDDWHNSVLEDVLCWIINSDKLKIHFNVNYDLPIIPVISSLCMTNREFAEPSQTQFTPYGSAISEDDIVTPFDDYLIPLDASPHTVLSSQCAGWIRSRLSDSNDDRVVGHITGVLRSNNQPLANQPIIVTNMFSGDVFELSTNASGIIQFENYYVNTCAYEIKHADGIYYPEIVSASIDVIGNADLGYVDFTAPQEIVYVDKDPSSNACHTISNAFEVAKGLSIPHIVVSQGTYNERVSVYGLGNHFQNFILEGSGTVVLHSDVRGCALAITNWNSDTLDELTIQNIIFEDSDNQGGGGVYLAGNIGNVTMNHCTIRNCGDNYEIQGSDSIPTGLKSSVPVHIIDCDFYDNDGHHYGSGCHTLGAVSLTSNGETNHSIIEDSRFHNNKASNASAIHVSGKGKFTIRDNTFSNNIQKMYVHTSCVKSTDAQNVEIIGNIFTNNFYPGAEDHGLEAAIGLGRTNSNNPSSVMIKNNTVVEQPRALYVHDVDVDVSNNIFDISRVGILCSGTYDDSRLKYYHNVMNLRNNATAAVDYDLNLAANVNNQFCDPLLDADYRPIWTATTMSPCIDAGVGDYDDDETPADIGAFRAIQHKYWDYEFEQQYDVDKWYWVSYPVLNSVTTDALKASEFFEELLQVHLNSNDEYTPTYLSSIVWRSGADPYQYSIYWDDDFWTLNQNTHYVSSPQGYKIKMQTRLDPGFSWPVSLAESGFRTPAITEFPIYAGVENWLGYFLDDPRMPQDAFADIWDDVTMVKAKDWSLF
ncbi:MAG TPA: right-handed parallel beta-helix repeat-containing protein, partial [Candidatus Cloacimonadota bacterium]|nr:right-handed parallel beta-helix repeat-containing protein [Candidatus Cloacimonadota bacterium]